MTKLHSRDNPVTKVTKTSDTKGPPTEEPNWTTWDEDTVKGALQEGWYDDEAINFVSGYPKVASRSACRVPSEKPQLPIPTSPTKMRQTRVSHTPVTPFDTSIKPVRPLTPFCTTPRFISFRSTNSDTSSRCLRSSTPGLTDRSSASTSPVSTPRSGSPFRSPSNCTLTTTLLRTPSPSPTVPKDSYPIPTYRPVLRPATPCPAQRSPPQVISHSTTLTKAFPASGLPIHAPSPWRIAACSPRNFQGM
jgi:hypothetical protein